jgi:hexaprenyl-diphosphate synthase
MNDSTASFASVFPLNPPFPPLQRLPPPPELLSAVSTPALAPLGDVLPTQLRLAQIVEMIHVASLLHDDVIDASPLRRGAPSAPAAFGNKLSVLGGDFLLGRASAALSRLGEAEVVELIAGVIANLVEGEIMQMQHAPGASSSGAMVPAENLVRENWNVYLKKTYLKTATLMAKGARAAVVLGGTKEGELWKEVAYAYGRNLGIAFQVIFFILDLGAYWLANVCYSLSSLMTYLTMRWVKGHLASPVVRTSSSASPLARHWPHGRNTLKWARSLLASSRTMVMSSR